MTRVLSFVLILSLLAVALAVSQAPKKKALRVTFSKTYLTNAHNEFRHLADPSLPPVTWSTQLAAEAWKVASACNTKLYAPNNLLCTSIPQVVGFLPRKYRNDMTLSILEDNSELTCPAMLLDASVTQVGCAVARCNPLKKATSKYDRPLKKGKWDSVVCKYNVDWGKRHCDSAITGPGLPKGQKSSRVSFNKDVLVTLHNEMRQARSTKLKPIAWSAALEKKALNRARACNPVVKLKKNEMELILSDSPNIVWDDADLKLNIQDYLETCPALIEVPKLTKFACASVLCGPRPKQKLKKVWQNVFCEYNTNRPKTCF